MELDVVVWSQQLSVAHVSKFADQVDVDVGVRRWAVSRPGVRVDEVSQHCALCNASIIPKLFRQPFISEAQVTPDKLNAGM